MCRSVSNRIRSARHIEVIRFKAKRNYTLGRAISLEFIANKNKKKITQTNHTLRSIQILQQIKIPENSYNKNKNNWNMRERNKKIINYMFVLCLLILMKH